MSQQDLSAIEDSLAAFHRYYFQHRAWEHVQQQAGVYIERSSALTLKTIHHLSGACRIQDIADQMNIEAPSITRRVQQLEADGLVRRSPDREDGRAIRVNITPRGKALLLKLQKAKQAHLAAALADWSTQDKHAFEQLLARFVTDFAHVLQD